MAEGHVVRYNAERFHAALAGKRIVRARWRSRRVATSPEEVVGQRVAQVDFAGKNHLFGLEDGGVFRVHLMQFGSTQLLRSGDRLRKPEARVRFLLGVRGTTVVVFSAPLVEWYPPGAPVPALATLGPDALREPFDARAFQANFRKARHATLAEALLDPAVVAGVGNVYKSEVLWATRIHPERRFRDLDAAERRALAAEVPRQMVAAYEGLRRGDDLWATRAVYRRSGRPCWRCGEPIASRVHGGRRTFFCPRCQALPPEG